MRSPRSGGYNVWMTNLSSSDIRQFRIIPKTHSLVVVQPVATGISRGILPTWNLASEFVPGDMHCCACAPMHMS